MSPHPSPKKYTIPAIIGNTLEMYEYALYGYFGPVIAKLFFSAPDQATRLMATFGVFAAGFLMRPLGAIIFGYLGDRYGRKKTLAAAILLMAIPTTAIGLLPTYAQVGVLSCVLLIICRLLQGLAVGGEFSGSMIYILEHAKPAQRGLYGGWVFFTGAAGWLLGSLTSALVTNTMSTEALFTWGWRVPFLSAIILGVIGLYLRLRMPETADFIATQEKGNILKNPVKNAFKEQWPNMLRFSALIFLPASAFFMFFIYISSYLNTFLNIELHRALLFNSIAMILFMPAMPLFGMLADKIGRKPVLLIGALGFCFFSYPGFMLLQQGTTATILAAQIIFGVLIAACYAPIPAVMVESLPTNLRYSTISLPFNVTVALSGAITPLFATFLVTKTNNALSPSYYLIAMGIMMFFAILSIKKQRQTP